MTTPLQRIANRANASRSTGPTSSDGKQTSRTNALRHGLTANTLLLDDEDGAVFDGFHQALMDELSPDGAMQAELAERLVSLMWRSRRFAGFEVAILEWMGHWSSEYFDLDGSEKGCNGPSERVQKFHKGLKPHTTALSPERRKRLAVGRLLHEGMNHNLMAKLGRYEAHVLGQLRRTHTEFLDERSRRRGSPAEALRRLDAMLELDASNRTDEPGARAPGPAIWT
ncbi:MAG: hypothetical protein GY948_04975 [Alphaproteobacteria bacterium]|nr:hypothetical protein [Alphaproteobacteria bacterium]